METTCYHGCADYNVDTLINNIKRNGFVYKQRENHWLGQGIYFFSENEWAKMWADQPKNFDKEKCIIEVKIFCEDKYFLDLDLYSTHIMIAEEIKNINNKLKNEKIILNFKDDNYSRCYYLDILKQKFNYKIIKQTFQLPNKNKITNNIGLLLNQVQFCVTNNKNIQFINFTKLNIIQIKKKKKLVIK